MEAPTFSILQRMKMPDGTYAVVLPINTTEEVMVEPSTNKNLKQELAVININITSNRDTVIDDMLNLVHNLYPYITKPLGLNHIYISDLSNLDGLNMTSGAFVPGLLFI